MSDLIHEYKEKQDGMNSRFKVFADEIAELKLDNFNTKESLKTAKLQLNLKDEKIKTLE